MNTRVTGWGPFRMPWEQRRLLKAAERARQSAEELEQAAVRAKDVLGHSMLPNKNLTPEQAAEEIVQALLPGAYAERDRTDADILLTARRVWPTEPELQQRYLARVREGIAEQVAVGDAAKEKILPILRRLEENR